MPLETLEKLVQSVLEYADDTASFSFQGGEPMLAGLDFYRNLLVLQKKYNTKNIKIKNAIQTNGTLINLEWAEFFRAHHFLVGVSLDGMEGIHNLNRVDHNGEGTYLRVIDAIKILDEFQVEYNILCVVTRLVAKHPEKTYRFFKKQGFQYLQFIPCLDGLEKQPGMDNYSLSPQLYGNFLKRLFDLWLKDNLECSIIYWGCFLVIHPKAAICGESAKRILLWNPTVPCIPVIFMYWINGNWA